MPASMMAGIDFEQATHSRRAELGVVTRDTLLPACASPAELGILVAGGPGTHSAYVQSFGNTRSVTREIT
jgi:hypothetical protein